ncbi:hypothetical protein MY1884_007068 [Beauveria asiatica]
MMDSNHGISQHVADTTPLLPDTARNRPKSAITAFTDELVYATTATLQCSVTNILLICLPLGLYGTGWGFPGWAVFVLNFLAMLPLASILTFSTEQLAAIVGSVAGGLINATFGNAVEMIVGISALKEGEIGIVQSSMIGSILSSILLILGSAFYLAGQDKQTVHINVDVAGILTSLMVISCTSLILPSALRAGDLVTESADGSTADYILTLSRSTSVILLIFYILYVYFQSVTHADLFAEEESDQGKKLHAVSSCAVLILATLGIASSSDALVDSIDGVVEALGISRSFIGLIIVPIVGNAGCFVGTVQWSQTARINLAISVIVGATLQISLFVTPFLVIVGWIIGRDMSLQFDTFETIVLTMSTLVVSCLVRGGKTNYFEGMLLVATYTIIGVAFFVHPDDV